LPPSPFLVLVGICIGIKDSLLWFNAEAGSVEAAIRAHKTKGMNKEVKGNNHVY
jgi:hypothetical protein